MSSPVRGERASGTSACFPLCAIGTKWTWHPAATFVAGEKKTLARKETDQWQSR